MSDDYLFLADLDGGNPREIRDLLAEQMAEEEMDRITRHRAELAKRREKAG